MGSFLSHNPEFVFKQQTSHDLCKIKSNQNCFKSKRERIKFLSKLKIELKDLPNSNVAVQKLKKEIERQIQFD